MILLLDEYPFYVCLYSCRSQSMGETACLIPGECVLCCLGRVSNGFGNMYNRPLGPSWDNVSCLRGLFSPTRKNYIWHLLKGCTWLNFTGLVHFFGRVTATPCAGLVGKLGLTPQGQHNIVGMAQNVIPLQKHVRRALGLVKLP